MTHTISRLLYIILIGSLFAFAGCGGSGGSSQLKLTLTSGATTATNVAIQGSIALPVGVSVRTDSSGYLLNSELGYVGAGISQLINAQMTSGIIDFKIVVADGFVSGDLITILVDVSSGNPQPADFKLSNVTATTNVGNSTIPIDNFTLTVK